MTEDWFAYKQWAAELENCEWCGQDLSELKSPNCQELCIDCTEESDWEEVDA
jgi:hypothetical protein